MKAMLFHSGWTCRHLEDKGAGIPVRIPHDAMRTEKRTPLSAGGINTGWYEGHDYCYENSFIPQDSWQGKAVILEFEGVYRKAEVWLNDVRLAFRPYGYTNFYVDLTDKLQFGSKNLLRVIARNADQPNSRWYSGAGIYRPVVLWVADKEHIALNGVRIRTLSLQPNRVSVSVKTTAPGMVQVEILDGETVLAQGKNHSEGATAFELEVPGAEPWSPESPRLYRCRVRFGTDEVTEEFGLRTLAWGKQGLLLNGQRRVLRGACIHHDNGLLGAVCDPDAVARKVRLLKEVGYDAIRSAHNPCSKALLRECDRQGMLVMDEYIDHWYIHKTEYDYVEHFDQWWQQDLQDMVEKDYNHPCVILYSTGNEVSETAQDKGIALTAQLTDYLHNLDDSRPVTCGINIFFNFLSSVGFGVYSDDKAKKEAEKAEKMRAQGKNVKKKAVGSQFFNNLAGLLGAEFMKRGATLHGCDIKTRDAFARMDIAGYNYGIYRYQKDLQKYPDRLILGSETFCSDAYRFYEQAKKEPRLIGDFVWAGMDYLGEVMVGAWEYRDYAKTFDGGPGWVSAGSGRIDLTGKLLCEARYTTVAMGLSQGPYIGVRPVNHTGDKHSPSAWKMTNAMESWSWPGCEGRLAEVEVYARAYKVELKLNGKTVGEKVLRNDCMARFRCRYEAGVLEAVAYDASGAPIGTNRLVTAEEETRLCMEPEEEKVRPNHLCYVRLRWTDDRGNLKPLVRDPVRIEVEGGTLEALGNACPYNERGYLTQETEPYYGEALAIVRAGESGAVTIRAEGANCQAQATIAIREEQEEK